MRMTGCNLRCRYCDTTYAYNEGSEISVEDIVEQVRKYGTSLVEITGGEPLLQQDIQPLIKRLLDAGFTVLVETNGSVNIRDVDKRAVIIMDIKTPQSGMFEKMDLSNLGYLKSTDEVKFVISGRDDYEWSRGFIQEHGLSGRCTILFSPVHGNLPPGDLAEWILHDRLTVRLNIQIHKYIYRDRTRGV